MAKFNEHVALIREQWFKPKNFWYGSPEVKLAQDGEDGWRLATDEEVADVWLHNTQTKRTLTVPYAAAQVERAQDHLEGKAPGNSEFVYATDAQIVQAKIDLKAAQVAYEEKVEKREEKKRADAAERRRTEEGGVA